MKAAHKSDWRRMRTDTYCLIVSKIFSHDENAFHLFQPVVAVVVWPKFAFLRSSLVKLLYSKLMDLHTNLIAANWNQLTASEEDEPNRKYIYRERKKQGITNPCMKKSVDYFGWSSELNCSTVGIWHILYSMVCINSKNSAVVILMPWLVCYTICRFMLLLLLLKK